MNNLMKKATASVLAASLVFGSSIPTFAATNIEKLDTLVQMNVIQGEGNGVDGTKTMVRYRSFVMMIRLLDLEDEMLAFDYDGADTFTDAEGQSEYVQRLMAYLKANPELGVIGYPDGSLQPHEEVSAKEQTKIMLTALGYEEGTDFTWNTVTDKAMELGVVSSESEINDDNFTVTDLANITYNTLSTTAKADVYTLGENIGYTIVETVIEPDTLEIEKVTTNNLKQIVIDFNMALDEAGDEDNYSLDDEDQAVIDSDSDFELSEDGKTVTITLTDAADQQETATLEIEDILDEDVDVEIEFLDTTIPTATKAEAVGVDTIKVYFSESMSDDEGTLTDEDNYEVYDADGDEIGVSSVTAGTNNMYALVEVQSDLDDDVTVVVDDVEDYAGLSIIETELNAAVTVDDAAPEVIAYDDASIYEVTLIFDEDIEFSDDDLDNFYHTNDDNTAESVEIDGDELTITFDSDTELPEGTAYIYIEDESITDLWDNENDDIKVAVEISSDEDAPEMDDDMDVDVDSDNDETTITLYFDEDIFEDDDLEITLYDEDGDDAEIGYDDNANDLDDYLDGDISDDDLTDELEIVFDDELSGEYTLEVEGLVDLYGNEIETISIDFDVDDEIKPDPTDFTATLYNEDDDEQLLVIDFGEAMDEDLVTDLSYYEFADVTLDDVDEDYISIDLVNDGEMVEIELDVEDQDDVAFVSGSDLTIGYFADEAGNYMTEYSHDLTLADGDDETIDVDSVELIDDETVEMTIGYELDDVDDEEFEFYYGDDTTTTIDIEDVDVDVEDGETIITFTLDTEDYDYATSTTTNGGLYYEILDDENDDNDAAGVTEYGQTLTVGAALVTDESTPEVLNIYVTDIASFDSDDNGTVTQDSDDDTFNAILVEFTEDLDADNFSAGQTSNGFTVSGGDADLDFATQYTTLGNNWIILYAEDDTFTEDTNISYDDTFGLTDEADNDLDSFTETDEMDEY